MMAVRRFRPLNRIPASSTLPAMSPRRHNASSFASLIPFFFSLRSSYLSNLRILYVHGLSCWNPCLEVLLPVRRTTHAHHTSPTKPSHRLMTPSLPSVTTTFYNRASHLQWSISSATPDPRTKLYPSCLRELRFPNLPSSPIRLMGRFLDSSCL